MLDSCLVFVAHNRSPSLSHMLERVGEDPRPLSGAHVLILQQVGVPNAKSLLRGCQV